MTEHHYSDQTLHALIETHGWEAAHVRGGNITSVRRQFDGIGPLGTHTTPKGQRNLYAGYGADPDRRRYIALTLGDAQIADLDGRDTTPDRIARLINLAAEQFADERRVKQGLEPIYAVGSPVLDLAPSGSPSSLLTQVMTVELYDHKRNAHSDRLRELCERAGIEVGPDSARGPWNWGDEHGGVGLGYDSAQAACLAALDSRFGSAWGLDASQGKTRLGLLDYVDAELDQVENDQGMKP